MFTPQTAPTRDEIIRPRYGDNVGTGGGEILAYIGEAPLEQRRPELAQEAENLKREP